jgi:hypothetical protein
MKRGHISLKTKLASALLTLGDIPYLDAKQMTADQIISLYSWDHYPVLHAIKVVDEHFNLVPRLIAPHRRKSAIDAGIIAKVKRLSSPVDPINRHLRKLIDLGVADETGKALPGELSRPKREKPKIAQKKNPWPPKGSRKIANRKRL